MTQAKALRLIKKHRPTTLLEAHELGLWLKHLGGGAYRSAYLIKYTELVIKFPDNSAWDSIEHACDEIKNYKKLKKSKVLRDYMPKFYYFDKKSGVSVWEYCPKRKPNHEFTANCLASLVGLLASEFTGAQFYDSEFYNIRGCDKMGIKFIDLGC